MDETEYAALGGRLDMARMDGWYERGEVVEIDPSFLRLKPPYAPLAPAGRIVVDLGGRGDCTPRRCYQADNTVHVVSGIGAWLGTNPRIPRRTLLIMSGVPSCGRFTAGLRARGGEWAVWYPGRSAEGHGPLGSAMAGTVKE